MITKLTIEYDGTDFAGWARQPGERTVQEVLERVLHVILGETGHDGQPLKLTVAGRTDAGVHAWEQVASYAQEAVDPLRLNGLLDGDLAVLTCEPAPESFDARRDATSRTYCYRVLARRSRGVFERGRGRSCVLSAGTAACRGAAPRARGGGRVRPGISPRRRPPSLWPGNSGGCATRPASEAPAVAPWRAGGRGGR